MANPVKILYVDYSHHGGGGQVFLMSILKHLDRTQWTPVLAAHKGSAIAASVSKSNVKVIEIDMGKASLREPWIVVPAFLRLREVIQSEKIQLVHTNGLMANKLAGPAASSLGIPSIWHKHTHIDQKPPLGAEWLWKMHSLFNERVLTVSQAVGHDLQGIGVEPTKVRILHNFVDAEPLDKSKVVSAAEKKKHGIPANVPLVGVIGNRKEHKGFDLFLQAAAQLVGKGGFWSKAHFVMMGNSSGKEPEFEMRLKSLEEDPSLKNRLHVLPAQPYPASWMKAFKLLVSPSRREGFGLVALESMVVGTPVVAAYPEAEEFIEDGKTGLLAKPNDYLSLAEAMERAMKSPQAAKKRAALAKKNTRAEYSASAYMEILGSYYQGALERHP